MKLVSGSKTKTITFRRVIKLDMADNEIVFGEFLHKSKSDVTIKPYRTTTKNGQTKFFSEKTDSIIQVDLNQINKLTAKRDVLGTTAIVACSGFIVTALIISPVLSIKKEGGFDTKKCLTISGISLGSAFLSAGVFILFDEKGFQIKPNGKKRTWTIQD